MDRVFVRLDGGLWLLLEREVFVTAARQGVELASPLPAAPAPTAEKLLTSKEMAALVGVHDTTIEARAKRGEIPCVRIGKALRFQPSEVLRALTGSREHR